MDAQNGSQPFKPDWYADPAGRHQLRYWDGSVWTDDVADSGQASTDPLAQAPPPWTLAISGTCDGCQTPIGSGKRVVYYTGTRTAIRSTGWNTGEETHSFGERSSVLLCQACAKGVAQDAVIRRKMVADGLADTEFWLEGSFVHNFGTQFFGAKNPGSGTQDPYFSPYYVKIRDIVRDKLATPEFADDATVFIPWKGRRSLGAAALTVELDDACVGLGCFTKDFVASVKVPAGVHKVSIGPPHPTPSRATQIIAFEPSAVYEMDARFSRASGRYTSEIRRTG